MDMLYKYYFINLLHKFTINSLPNNILDWS